MAFEGEGGQPVPVIQPVIDTGEKELVDPVLNLTEKTTRIEERQAQQEERLVRQIGEVEERLQNATGEHARHLEERLSQLEARLEEALSHPAKEVEHPVAGAVELAEPVVESSPAPPEKVRRGLRARRRARRRK